MIVERLVIRAKFGQGDVVAAAFKEAERMWFERFGLKCRTLVDLTGPMFTVVAENEYRDMAHLAEMQALEQQMYGEPEFQTWFASWSAATESATRELYQVVE
ncbi:MAG: hypothetical protein U0531_03735 [Dehalococcoidia bacterium]